MGFLCHSVVNNLPAMQEMQEMEVRSLGQEDPLEEEMAHILYSCLENRWKILRPQSIGPTGVFFQAYIHLGLNSIS